MASSPVDNKQYITKIEGHHWNPFGRRYKTVDTMNDYAACDSMTYMRVQVPPGMKWDGPTAYPVTDWRNNLMLYASAFHDELYASDRTRDARVWLRPIPGDRSDWVEVDDWSRGQADRFFKNLLKKYGMADVRADFFDGIIHITGSKVTSWF